MIRQPLYTDSATEAYNAMLELGNTFGFSEDIDPKVKTFYYKILELVSELSKHANQVPKVSERNRKLEALFLGPRGENMDVLQSMIIKGLGTHRQSRREYHKNDPIHITGSMKKTDSYQESQEHMQSKFFNLLALLKKYSVPFYSPRYQGHMVWEQTIPSIAGYVSAMLYNPNNIAFEASPITTVLELLCAQDLCKLFDFPKFERMIDPKNKAHPEENINSWGHLTCDGTIANMEGLWASRNAKYYPFAIKRAMLKEPNLKAIADQLLVKTAEIFAKRGQPKRFVDCSLWELMNIPLDEILCLTHRIFKLLPDCLCIEEVYNLILKYSVQKKGILDTYRKMEKIFPPKDNGSYKLGKIFVSASKHYSLPKAVNLLGLGEKHLVNVTVTEDSRLDMEDLSKKLCSCGEKQIPVMTVIVVMGSTEESSVDPLSKVLKLRDALRKSHGLDFNIHADCAFGGYFKSTLVEEPQSETINDENDDYAPLAADLNKYTQKQFKLLHQVDTLTVDPHKSGYVPFACGAFLYRNGLLRNMLLFTGPYIGTQGPNVGIFGIEGSKAGAQAAAVYLSHQCLPLNRLGHGMLLRLTLFNTKIYYIKLLAFESRFQRSGYKFKAIPLPRLPLKRKGKSLTEDFDVEKIAAMDNDKIAAKLCTDAGFREWFNELGPDQNILLYAFNFYDIDQGQWNKSLERMNKFNHELYKKMSPHINRKTEMPADLDNKEMLVSKTEIFQSVYGNKFFKNFIDRTSTFDDTKSQSVKLLRSVLMNPWSSETKGGSFIDNILKTLDGICCEVMSNRIKWDPVKPPKFREAPLI